MSTNGSELKHIWQPLDIGPTRVKHRIMMTAQTIQYSDDHILGDRHIAFYRERAMGGAALLITEQQAAHHISKGSFYLGCTAHDKRAVAQYAKLADAVHEHGCKQFVQLFAAGVHDKGTVIFDEWHPLWGVSRTPSIVHREVPMEMEKEHILDIIKAYGESALNVKTSGLDGVEIHGAHSYLIGQFFSRAYNKRTDEYGGSVENRARFAIEAAESVREQVGDDITVGIRLSFDEFLGDGGITVEESEETVAHLAATGLFDYFNISGGGYHTLFMAVPPMNMPDGPFIPFAEKTKEIVGHRAKVFIVGKIRTGEMAEQAIAEGKTDMVAMTRMQMADPYMVTKLREGRSEDIVKCINANVCLNRLFDQKEVVCVMNPAVGRERELGEEAITYVNGDGKKLVVVGGGPAGMRFAGTAARRGHDVTLLESGDKLGGHLNLLQQLPTRESWGEAVSALERRLEKHGVDVRLGTEATSADIGGMSADVAMVATGSTWSGGGFSPHRPERDGIPGAELDHVIDVATAAERALGDPSSLGKKVLIVDESTVYLPLGLAELLLENGVEVEVVSPHFFVGADALKTMDLFHLYPRLKQRGIGLTSQHFVEKIEGSDVTLYHIWGGEPEVRSFDTVVLSQMRDPNEGLYHELKDDHADVRRVGDALTPRPLVAVMHEGESEARAV